jgi:hypothetical protein
MSEKQSDDNLVRSLEAAERARRSRAMLVGGLVVLIGVGGLGLSFTYRDEVFRPKLDVAEGEVDVIEDTNDPQCRAFIAEITAVGKDYVEIEPRLTDKMLGDDVATIEGLVKDLEGLKVRLVEAREKSQDAELRFDDSRSEVKEWFRYTDNELTLIQRVGTDRVGELAVAQPDAGTLVEDGQVEKSKKPMPERLSGATLAANEAFQKFRVWHTGGLHPCGAADEGETPWAPETK